MDKAKIVIGVIGADVHAVGNRILEYAFSSAGFDVTNLGVMVSQEEFIAAAIETDADAILVSSLYGHGELDVRGLREKCDESGLEGILLYVGGNIVVGKQPFAEVEKRFKKMGFDRVFAPGTPPEVDIYFLKKDLGTLTEAEREAGKEIEQYNEHAEVGYAGSSTD
ncbi:MAG TPA: methylaspartate mutase subunit S [Clostridiaceae bacterium]|nr:methylaspartate mutase subunit S [Clostridiaceae bacterium]